MSNINSKKDRLSERQPEASNGLSAGLQIAAATAGSVNGNVHIDSDNAKQVKKNKKISQIITR